MGTELPDRKGNRLKGYDYSARGVYFVTICTQNRVCNLDSVVGADARIGPRAHTVYPYKQRSVTSSPACRR